MGFIDKWPEYERFKAGDQWPAPTPKTKNLPRPVFNIIRQIEAHKVSSILNENIRMVFSPEEINEEPNEDTLSPSDLFTRNADATWENIKQSKLNEEALENGSNRGTCIWHYYWDTSVEGGTSLKWIGDMRGEVIDPMNYFPGNPQCREVEKQPYNIITKRGLVEDVRQEARDNGLKEELLKMIKADKETQNEGYNSAKVELDGSDKVTVIIKYWRDKKTGLIWFIKVASGIVLKEPTNTEMSRYPIALMQYEKREKSIFGIGDTEGLIPNQKAINYLMAMQLLSVQNTGWPKLVYKKNAINPRLITNTPGEMIEDQSAGDGINVRYLNPGNISSVAQMLTDKFIEYTEKMTGAYDVARGEKPGGQLNATAIMLLQKAAGIPIEGIRRRFYQAMEDIGLIWMEFWKVKYNLPRFITIKNDESKEYSTRFLGTDYKDINFNLRIDIGPASSYSESLMMSSLDNFLNQKYITFDMYLKYVPKNVVPFKERLLKEIDQTKQREAMMAQLLQQNKIMMEMFKKLPAHVQQDLLSQVQQQPQEIPPNELLQQPMNEEVV